MRLRIRGGLVHDPAHYAGGRVRDIFIDGDRIVDSIAEDFVADRVIDARDRVVLPGAVDIHCHIAGSSVNRARRLARATTVGERDRDGAPNEFPLLPSTRSTGMRYAALGYTTAIEAAIAPTSARQCHLELADTPNLDRGFLLLLANHELLLEQLARGERELARETIAWLLRRTGAFGIKAVNPGGVAHWKSRASGVASFSEPLDGLGVSPRQVLELLVDAAEHLRLPHPVHIHCNHLGEPGNIEVTLETSRALLGRRHHLTHVQFHAYGVDDAGGFRSAAELFIAHLHAHPELSADVGQVMFGDALTLSADEELEHRLWQLTGNPWVNLDIELETGCGIVPIRYLPRSRLHSLQWAIGLELLLLSEDPWRLSLSTDHPNGASFLTYPVLIAQLMDAGLRREAIALADDRAIASTRLPDLSREYTLDEVVIVTRAGPARSLGLHDRGHLAPGARADITIHDDTRDREAMFRWPLTVIQGGDVIVDGGEPRRTSPGRTLRVAPPADDRARASIGDWFARFGSYSMEQLGLPDDELAARTSCVEGSAP